MLIGTEDRLLKYRKIDPITGCWIFTGCLHPQGYGLFYFEGRPRKANRIAAYLWLGLDINDSKQFACHKDDICNNKACFNPDHLYVGTSQDNVRDMKKQPQKIKTHCKNGHEYTPSNTGKDYLGNRRCKICRDTSQAKIKANEFSDLDLVPEQITTITKGQ